MRPYPPPRRCLLTGLLLLVILGAGGCLFDALCTPADSTYSCCLKQHPTTPAVCSASEKEAAQALKQAISPGPSARVESVAVGGTVIAATTLSSDEVIFSETLRVDVEKALRECAKLANEVVNRRRFGGDPTPAQCEEVLGKDSRGRPVTRAMQLGEEKHAEAMECAAKRLGGLIPGRFSLEQRYRYDPVTRRKELVSKEQRTELLRQGKGSHLKGTLVPDVAIHSGNPLEVQAVYDFKFPCLRESLPKWSTYNEEGHPYRDRTQGDVYEAVFGEALRVTPWEII